MTGARPLVIVGGGPAGMAAAIEAGRAGLVCTLLDEAPRLGGQIYRQPPEHFQVTDACALGKDFVRGEQLRAELKTFADRIEVISGTSVLGIWRGREILWASHGTSGIIEAERLIFATGAYERPVPFPGWTLPGVMTAGGMQTIIKTMQVRPGRRALVAGTGPLILSAASRLLEIGVDVVAVLEAGRPLRLSAPPVKEGRESGFAEDTGAHEQRLRQAGIPLLFNHTVFGVYGKSAVERASYGPVDPDSWRPHKELAQSAEIDLMILGFGFVPNTELTELAGCRHQYVAPEGGWVPVRDAMMQTTVPGVFAVGDGAGIRGALASMEEGRVAGITAAEQAGVIRATDAANKRETPLALLRSLSQAKEAYDGAFQIQSGLLDLIDPDTLLCRCEEITLGEVRAALDQGARDLQAVKLLTRLGMGPCQGRNCAPSAGMYLCQMTGCTPEQTGRISPRPPVRPVTLGTLAYAEQIPRAAGSDSLDAGGAS